MSNLPENGLHQAYELMKGGNPSAAVSVLEETLSQDLENAEIVFAIKCANHWRQPLDIITKLDSPYEKGEHLVRQWKEFSAYIGDRQNERAVYAMKSGIFTLALENYNKVVPDGTNAQKAEIKRKTGLCFKKLGDYESARYLLEEAYGLKSDSAAILAELADCYALCGEEKNAKAFFREAFYINAQEIETEFLDAEIVTRLIQQVQEAGYTGKILKEWIPVYGVLYGVFSVTRELRALEAGKLKQNVFALENEIKEAGSEVSLLTPRLINHYFWLIDYYVNTNEERARINEVLLKIKLLDPRVYDRYTA
ncbi:MAG: tetratricopeptide repeat protein [Treponema sp.]|nr:tetratricopeptide repeat protein [Candidatus Treponema caballi]